MADLDHKTILYRTWVQTFITIDEWFLQFFWGGINQTFLSLRTHANLTQEALCFALLCSDRQIFEVFMQCFRVLELAWAILNKNSVQSAWSWNGAVNWEFKQFIFEKNTVFEDVIHHLVSFQWLQGIVLIWQISCLMQIFFDKYVDKKKVSSAASIHPYKWCIRH